MTCSDRPQPHPLLDLSRAQHGLVGRWQLASTGLSKSAVEHLKTSGRWYQVTPRVLSWIGHAASEDRRLMLMVLHNGPDCYLTRGPALMLWGLPGFGRSGIDVVQRRSHRERFDPICRVHTSTDIRDSQITTLRGLPIATPARAIVDLAATGHAAKVERALDNAWARHLVNPTLMKRTIDEMSRRGRPGIGLIRELLEVRGDAFRPPESGAEARVNHVLVEAGQRPLVRQIDIGDDVHWVGRVDLCDDEVPLIVEVQSELFHGSLLDRQRDAVRLGDLRAAGFTVLEVWEAMVWHRPADVVAQIQAARFALGGYQAATPAGWALRHRAAA